MKDSLDEKEYQNGVFSEAFRNMTSIKRMNFIFFHSIPKIFRFKISKLLILSLWNCIIITWENIHNNNWHQSNVYSKGSKHEPIWAIDWKITWDTEIYIDIFIISTYHWIKIYITWRQLEIWDGYFSPETKKIIITSNSKTQILTKYGSRANIPPFISYSFCYSEK